MTRFAPQSEADSLHLRQLQAAAAIKVRPWSKAYTVTVRRALAWFGVTEREDRADLAQDVFFSAYLALVRGEQIENPRAWLRECARKHASNYRHKARRRSPHIGGDPLVYGKDPEQIMSDRERLTQALAVLTEGEKEIVLDIRVDGVSWGPAAQERGITIDQARYLYERAISKMDKALFDSGKRGFRRTAGTRSTAPDGVGTRQ
jgi:DNA-directed RNA polymerase specialized sigma24 family protein